jgi:hypothetical protein
VYSGRPPLKQGVYSGRPPLKQGVYSGRPPLKQGSILRSSSTKTGEYTQFVLH